MPPVYIAKFLGVKIPVHKNGKGRYCIRWRPNLGAPPLRETFGQKSKATERADEIARGIGQGLADVLTLTHAERDSYRAAVQIIEPFGRDLHSVCGEWAEAQKILGSSVSLLEIVREWNQRHLFEQCEYYQFRPPPEPMVAASSNGEDIPETPGIYFVWSGGQIVYVGRSASLHKRCRISTKHNAIFAGDWISWLEEPLFRLKFGEAFFVGMLHPVRNFAGPSMTQPGQPTLVA